MAESWDGEMWWSILSWNIHFGALSWALSTQHPDSLEREKVSQNVFMRFIFQSCGK